MNKLEAASENFNKAKRSMETVYNMGTNEAGETIEVEVYSSHDKDRKAYRTTIMRGTVRDSNGFKVKSYSLFEDTMGLRSERVARYNASNLMAWHWESLKYMEDLRGSNAKLDELLAPVKELATV